MAYSQPQHVKQRTLEIAETFEENKDAILSDLQSLELSIRSIAEKWRVNDHNVRRWAYRLGIDIDERSRKRALNATRKPKSERVRTPPPITQDRVRNPKLLSMKW